MQAKASIDFEGKDIGLASDAEMAAGAAAALAVFVQRQADPLACAASSEKRINHVLLSREDALNCVIWDEANYAAWHTLTRGWLRRDVDIHIRVGP